MEQEMKKATLEEAVQELLDAMRFTPDELKRMETDVLLSLFAQRCHTTYLKLAELLNSRPLQAWPGRGKMRL